MTCKNCAHNFDGNFCNNCGQKSTVDRVNFKYLREEITSSLFQVNRGIFFTIKELATRPGHSIKEFLAGKRKKHFKPIAFAFLTATLYFLSTLLGNRKTFLSEAISGVATGISDDGKDVSVGLNILNWLANNHAYSTLIILPIFAFTTYLAFKGSKYNYFEHLIINAFITGQQMIIYFTFSLLFLQINENDYLIEGFPIAVGILYNLWAFSQFFNTKKLFHTILLMILAYLLFFILSTAFIIFCVMLEGLF